MSRKKVRYSAKLRRKENALEAQTHLSSVISNYSMPKVLRKSAARHLLKTSTKNRLPLPPSHRHWICRGCSELLIPGDNCRIRIREGQRTITCLMCGRVRRHGGGPKSHRRS